MRRRIVAQIFNLLYRGIAFRHPPECSGPGVFGRAADCKSAIQQIKNLRYVTVILFGCTKDWGVLFAEHPKGVDTKPKTRIAGSLQPHPHPVPPLRGTGLFSLFPPRQGSRRRRWTIRIGGGLRTAAGASTGTRVARAAAAALASRARRIARTAAAALRPVLITGAAFFAATR